VTLGYFVFDKFVLDPGRDAAMLKSVSQQFQEKAAPINELEDPSETSIHKRQHCRL
jgi:hypothetical protein